MGVNSLLYRYSLILVIGVTAGLLLNLSWPRLQASLSYLPIDTAISRYWETREFDRTQLNGLIKRAEQSIATHDHYRYWEGLSELQILKGQEPGKPIWLRRPALEKAISAAEEAIRRAPSKPRNWLSIARAKSMLLYPPEEVVAALKMSILTGRVEPTMMLVRLELGLLYLQELDAEGAQLLRDQAVLTWTSQQGTMLRRIKSGAMDLDQLREVLSSNNQAIISEMEAHFEK
jgi:hypothetical protein